MPPHQQTYPIISRYQPAPDLQQTRWLLVKPWLKIINEVKQQTGCHKHTLLTNTMANPGIATNT
jgi:hypothetical protein